MSQFKCSPGRNQTFSGAPLSIFLTFPGDTYNDLLSYLLLSYVCYGDMASRRGPRIPLPTTLRGIGSSHLEFQGSPFSLRVISTTAGLGCPCLDAVSFSPPFVNCRETVPRIPSLVAISVHLWVGVSHHMRAQPGWRSQDNSGPGPCSPL